MLQNCLLWVHQPWGFAKPMLNPALVSSTAVVSVMETIEYELKIAMFCTNSRCLDDLKGKIMPLSGFSKLNKPQRLQRLIELGL